MPQSHRLGQVLFCTLDNVCPCGLSVPVFVVLNDLLRERDPECVSAETALAGVEELLPPAALETGLLETRCMLHRGDEAEAVLLAEALARRFPDRAEVHFNAGCSRQRLGDTTDALAHYRRSLALHPQLEGAWLNRGILLRQLGRLEEARLCLARVRQLGGQPAAPTATPEVLLETPGKFDTIRVLEDGDLRALFIGAQCQGAMYRHTDDGGSEPGPYAYSPFTTGWLLAGCHAPEGKGVMLGLGCGAGAVSLLTCFPKLSLRVVEIDEQLIDVALRLFPRLAQLRRSGRLEIVCADAREFVASSGAETAPVVDFVLLDAFTGEPEPPALLQDTAFLRALGSRARLLLANAIFTLNGAGQRCWLDALDAAGCTVARMYPTVSPEHWSTRASNWILSTRSVTPAPDRLPFAASSHLLAEAVRNDFRAMCARAIAAPPRHSACVAPPPPGACDGRGAQSVVPVRS